MFKIFNPNTGLFRKPNGWSKFGKIWNKMSHLKSHISLNEGSYARDKASVIIEYEMVEVARYSIQEWVAGITEARVERETKRKERREAYQREAKIRQYEQLKKELGV